MMNDELKVCREWLIIHPSSFLGRDPFSSLIGTLGGVRVENGIRATFFFLTRMNWDHTDDTATAKMEQ
jgi:hypothetical protein